MMTDRSLPQLIRYFVALIVIAGSAGS